MSVSGVDESAKQPPLLILIFPFYPPPPPPPASCCSFLWKLFTAHNKDGQVEEFTAGADAAVSHTTILSLLLSVNGARTSYSCPYSSPFPPSSLPSPLTPLPGPETSSQQKQITSSFQSAWISATNNSIINSDPGSSSDQSLYHCI